MRRVVPLLDPASEANSGSPTISEGGASLASDERASGRELEVGVTVGRYVVVARVGSGGMGVVYLAYDPELDRRVALKVLDRSSSSDDRTRSLSEARALARLTHPNVVAVYDVGTIGERVWLAMEFVEGLTLTQWYKAEDRSWREVLDVLVAAGAGLRAAHAANLAHRDFKPDNVMVGQDREHRGVGRVVVTDFGLARSIDPQAIAVDAATVGGGPAHTPVRGTPAYMAPEQHVAGAADARIDQFAFCVTLWETLYGERPFAADNIGALVLAVTRGEIRAPPESRRVPRWLRRAIERGLASDPTARWPSMAELLEHLHRGKSRNKRRWIAAGFVGAAALAGAVVITDRARLRMAERACVERGASIAAVWPGTDDAARGALRAAFDATGVAAASPTFDRAAERLDAWTTAWRERMTSECEAAIHGRDAELHAAADACLDAQASGLGALLETLADRDTDILRRAVPAVAALADPARCRDDADLLRRPVPPPDAAERVAQVRRDLQRSRMQRMAGRFAAAEPTSETALREAKEIGWSPLVAVAMVEHGNVRDRLGDAPGAEELLQAGYLIALAADDPDTAADAAIGLVWVVGVALGRPDDGLLWGEHAAALLGRMGQEETLRGAALMIGRASVLRSTKDHDAAIAQLERGIALRRAILGEDHPDVGAALNNLGNVRWQRGDLDEASALFEDALRILEVALGPDHPDLATTTFNLGNVLWSKQDVEGAARYFEEAYALLDRTLGSGHPEAALPLVSLAEVDSRRGDFESAIARDRKAIAILRGAGLSDRRELEFALRNLGMTFVWSGSYADADRSFAEALALTERAGLESARHADTLSDRGLSYLERGLVAEAKRDLETAVPILERYPEERQTLAKARARLAAALARSGDITRAHESCSAAFSVYETSNPVVAADDWLEGLSCRALVELGRGRFAEAARLAEHWLDVASHVTFSPARQLSMRLVLADALWGLPTVRWRSAAEATRAADDALGDRRALALAWIAAHPD